LQDGIDYTCVAKYSKELKRLFRDNTIRHGSMGTLNHRCPSVTFKGHIDVSKFTIITFQ